MIEVERHELLDGRLHVYRRPHSRYWQASTYLAGKEWRSTTKQDVLAHAKEWAEDWYLDLRGKQRAGVLKHGKTFAKAAAQFQREYATLTQGERSAQYVEYLNLALRVHLIPYFGPMLLADITPGAVQEYRIHRAENPSKRGAALPVDGSRPKPPARSTLNHELVALRQVLKTANRHGWLSVLPDLSAPYKMSGKIGHRGWFSPDEYKKLYTATRERADQPLKPRWKHECEQLHDFVLFMANTGLRPDEAWNLEYRDVTIARDEATNQTILEIEVRGKRGVGHCKSMPGAVLPFRRLRTRNAPEATDRIFPSRQRELFNAILDEQGLKIDRDGNRRTAYSLRHTYICLRLMEGADIYQVAKNCRTSVEMIEKHYARHIKNTLDAASINVRRERHAPNARRRSASRPRRRKTRFHASPRSRR
jgi:integrase